MAEPPLVARLRRLGRGLGLLSLLLGAVFIVLARRSGDVGGDVARWLFAGAALLQFALAWLLLRTGSRR
ncbi:MAG: hypothetical protein WCO11_10025 [Sphingomonadales bacterium]|jgi:hypothetical protein